MRRLCTMIAAAGLVVACTESPTGLLDDSSPVGELVITKDCPPQPWSAGPGRPGEFQL